MATKARSPARRPAAGPATGRREASPQQLVERVKELESAEREAKKIHTKEQKQRQRELAEAKKKIAKELQSASRLVQKGEREANRLTTKADQVEKQAEQAKQKAARQHAQIEESLGRFQAKRHGIESSLHDKMSGIGEAKGRLAHAAFAAKMLEAGVIVPIDGTADYEAAGHARPQIRRRARSPGADGAVDDDLLTDGEALGMDGDEELDELREDNRRLRERLRGALEEIERLKQCGGLAHEGGEAAEFLDHPAQHSEFSSLPGSAGAMGFFAPPGAVPSGPVVCGSVSLPFPARAAPLIVAHAASAAAAAGGLSPGGPVARTATAFPVPPVGSVIAPGAPRVFMPPPTTSAATMAAAAVAGASPRMSIPPGVSVVRQVSGVWPQTLAAPPQNPPLLPGLGAQARLALAESESPVAAAVASPSAPTGTASTLAPSPRTPQMEVPGAMHEAQPLGAPLLMNIRNYAATPGKPMGKPIEPVARPKEPIAVPREPIAVPPSARGVAALVPVPAA